MVCLLLSFFFPCLLLFGSSSFFPLFSQLFSKSPLSGRCIIVKLMRLISPPSCGVSHKNESPKDQRRQKKISSSTTCSFARSIGIKVIWCAKLVVGLSCAATENVWFHSQTFPRLCKCFPRLFSLLVSSPSLIFLFAMVQRNAKGVSNQEPAHGNEPVHAQPCPTGRVLTGKICTRYYAIPNHPYSKICI